MVVDVLKTAAVMEESPENSKAVDEGEVVNPGEIISYMEANVEGKDSTEVTEIMITDIRKIIICPRISVMPYFQRMREVKIA